MKLFNLQILYFIKILSNGQMNKNVKTGVGDGGRWDGGGGGGEVAGLVSVFRAFVRFALVWVCRFPLPLGVWEGLRFVIVALPGLFSYLFILEL